MYVPVHTYCVYIFATFPQDFKCYDISMKHHNTFVVAKHYLRKYLAEYVNMYMLIIVVT